MRHVALQQWTRGAVAVWGVAAMCVAAGTPGPALAQGGKKTANFNISSERTGPGMQMTVTGTIWLTATQARMDVKDPMAGEVQVLVTNGFIYQLQKKTKKGVRAPLPPEMKKSPDNFNFFLSQFAFDASTALKDAKKLRSESVSGIQCDVLTRSATKGEASRSVTVWMPQKQSPQFPIKVVQEDKLQKPGANLTESMTITLSNVKVGMEIPAATFAVPAGYKIEAAKPGGPGAPGGRPAPKKK